MNLSFVWLPLPALAAAGAALAVTVIFGLAGTFTRAGAKTGLGIAKPVEFATFGRVEAVETATFATEYFYRNPLYHPESFAICACDRTSSGDEVWATTIRSSMMSDFDRNAAAYDRAAGRDDRPRRHRPRPALLHAACLQLHGARARDHRLCGARRLHAVDHRRCRGGGQGDAHRRGSAGARSAAACSSPRSATRFSSAR